MVCLQFCEKFNDSMVCWKSKETRHFVPERIVGRLWSGMMRSWWLRCCSPPFSQIILHFSLLFLVKQVHILVVLAMCCSYAHLFSQDLMRCFFGNNRIWLQARLIRLHIRPYLASILGFVSIQILRKKSIFWILCTVPTAHAVSPSNLRLGFLVSQNKP